VISITDGQIYLESDLFYAGQRPALNVGISVSRVGGDAQTNLMKKVAGGMRLDLAQFRSLESFAQFGSDLDKSTQRQLDRGLRLTELLKQPQYQPISLSDQVVLIFAGTNGYLEDVTVERVEEWQENFLRFFNTQYSELVDKMMTEQKMTDEIREGMAKACERFNETWD